MKKLAILLFGSVVLLNAGSYSFEAVGESKEKRNLIPDMSQFVSKNISRKSAGSEVIETCTDISKVFRSDKQVILSSESFGPLPVTFKLVNKNGIKILEKTNEDNVTSKFEISVDKLETGTQLQVFNAFDETIFCSNVKLMDQNSSK